MIGIEDWARYLLGLIVVLVLIFFAARGFKAVSEGALPGRLRRVRRLGIEEFLPLDGRRRLVLLRHDEREYLVLLGQQGETLLNVADRPAQPAGADSQPPPAAALPANGWAALAAQLRRRRHRADGSAGVSQ